MRRAPFHVTGPDGSFIIRELLTEDALERKRVADVIGDAFEYDAWFKKDGEPRRLAGGAKEVHDIVSKGASTFLVAVPTKPWVSLLAATRATLCLCGFFFLLGEIRSISILGRLHIVPRSFHASKSFPL